MAGTFTDGFPQDPLLAVQAATFLTTKERDEWLSWLNSAGPDDKAELVNTLHEIWVENNSQNKPASAQSAPLAPSAPMPMPVAFAPAPVVAQVQAPAAPTPPPAAPLPIPTLQPAQAPAAPKPEPIPAPAQALPPKPVAPQYSFKKVEETQNRLQQRPESQGDRRPPERRDDRRPQPTPQGNQRNDAPRPQDNRPQAPKTSNFVDLSKMQTEKTRSILDKFMADFSQTRKLEEQSLTQLKNAILGVEEVVNYSDLLAEKILALNASQVNSSKLAAKTKDEVTAKVDDVMIKIDDVQTLVERAQEEIDRMSRRQRAFESDVKDMMSKMNEQISGFSTDQFSGSDKLAILGRRLDRIEEVKNTPSKSQSQDRQPERKTARQELAEMEVEVPKMNMEQNSNTSSSNFMPLKLNNTGKIEE